MSETGQVSALSQEGAGIVTGGKTAFVAGALPGESVRFTRRKKHRQYDEAQLEEVLSASPERIAPKCAQFGVCGGCALQHLDSAAQLALKQRQLAEGLERIGGVQPARWLEPLAGPSWNYRRRARLGARYVRQKDRALVGFRERLSSFVTATERCEVLVKPIDALIAPLSALIYQLSIRERLPQIEVAAGDNASVLVLRVLSAPSEPDLALLRAFEAEHGVHLLLQPGGLNSIYALSPPAPSLHYRLEDYALQMQFEPTDFIQVNGVMNQALIGRALELLAPDADARVLDLFCGLGNFTLPLGRRAAAVVGVEGDAALVARARANAERNGVANASFFTQDLSAEPAPQAPWLAGGFTHVLLDPPRLGARPLLGAIARLAPQRVLYVSCHPGTLARDLGELVHVHGFELLAAGVVDMFPHTAHVESLALLAAPVGRRARAHGP